MIVINWKVGGWNLPSLLTFSMTIQSTIGQMMKADFINIESLPLVSSSVFEMESGPPARIFKGLASQMEMDIGQINHFHGLHSDQSLPILRPVRMKSNTSSSTSFNEALATKLVTQSSENQAVTQTESQVYNQSTQGLSLEKVCSKFTKSWNFKCQLFGNPCPNNLSRFRWNGESMRTVLKKTNNFASLKKIGSQSHEFTKPCSIDHEILFLKQIEKCTRTCETQLTLKACVIKETSKFNPVQVQGYCENYVKKLKVYKLAFELRRALNKTQPLKIMDPLNLLNDVEVEDFGDAEGDELNLLGQIAFAEPFEEENMEEYDIEDEVPEEDNNEQYRNADRFYSDSEEPSDNFYGSYTDLDHSPLPRRTPSPRPLTRILEDIYAQEFLAFGNQDFRISGDDTSQISDCEQDFDLEDHSVPTSQ